MTADAADSLRSARNEVAARYLEVAQERKPNYNVGGDSYNWADYLRILGAELDSIDARIAKASGPFEVVSQAE